MSEQPRTNNVDVVIELTLRSALGRTDVRTLLQDLSKMGGRVTIKIRDEYL